MSGALCTINLQNLEFSKVHVPTIILATTTIPLNVRPILDLSCAIVASVCNVFPMPVSSAIKIPGNCLPTHKKMRKLQLGFSQCQKANFSKISLKFYDFTFWFHFAAKRHFWHEEIFGIKKFLAKEHFLQKRILQKEMWQGK